LQQVQLFKQLNHVPGHSSVFTISTLAIGAVDFRQFITSL
jgi:hypothetical protein